MYAVLVARPVTALLLAIGILFGGLGAYELLPRSSMPKLDLPLVIVSAELNGADAEAVMQTVTNPLVEELTRISAVRTLEGTSSEGRSTITVEVDERIGVESVLDDIQLALTRATRRLPLGMTRPPTYERLDPTDVPVIQLAMTSQNHSISELEEMAFTALLPALDAIPAVRQVSGLDYYRPAIRISLDPVVLAARQVSVGDVETILRAHGSGELLGRLGGDNLSTTVSLSHKPKTLGDFAGLTVIGANGQPVSLGEIGQLAKGIEHDTRISLFNGKPAVLVAVHAHADADMARVAQQVRAMVATVDAQLPNEVTIDIARDRSIVVEAAVRDVEWTLVATIVLMLVLLYLVTSSSSATFIPSLILPLSLGLTLVGLYAFGLTLNNITLIALTLSVGLVVDDAIVVHENIVRHIEEGSDAVTAAIQGVKEVSFTVVAMTASLAVVFTPMFFMEGVLGRIMFSFATTVVLALCASAIVSLVLSPVIAAYWFRRTPTPPRAPNPRSWFSRLIAAYGYALSSSLRHPWLMLALALATLGASIWLIAALPRSFLPDDDNGQLAVSIRARPDISTAGMLLEQSKAAAIIQASPHVRNILFEAGAVGTHRGTGTFHVELQSTPDRPDLGTVVKKLQHELNGIPSIRTTVASDQAARMNRARQSLHAVTIQATTFAELDHWSARLQRAMEADSDLRNVASSLATSVVQQDIDVDGVKASYMGIDVPGVRRLMHAAFSGSELATAFIDGRTYGIYVDFDLAAGSLNDWLGLLHQRAATGQLVPLSALVEIKHVSKPLQIDQMGLRPSAEISFATAPHVSLDKAVRKIRDIVDAHDFPSGVTVALVGHTREFDGMLSSQTFLIFGAVFAMYFILAVLYESLAYPLVILSGLPSAALGGAAALMLFNTPISLMAMIGMLVLLGIVKKNAIMMIDVALAKQREGAPARDAIQQAAVQRFRPIMLTTVAALAAALPIAIGLGQGGELRQPLGIVVAGGLILSQFITLFITPTLFVLVNLFQHSKEPGYVVDPLYATPTQETGDGTI